MKGLICLAAVIVIGITMIACADASDRPASKTQTNISVPNSNDAAPAANVVRGRDADDAAVENRAAKAANVENADKRRLDRDDVRVNSDPRKSNNSNARRDADDRGKRYEDDDDGR